MRSGDDLALYVHGLLKEDEEASMQVHVGSCADCAEQVFRIWAEQRLLKDALRRDRVDPSEEARMVEAVLERRPVARPRPKLRH